MAGNLYEYGQHIDTAYSPLALCLNESMDKLYVAGTAATGYGFHVMSLSTELITKQLNIYTVEGHYGGRDIIMNPAKTKIFIIHSDTSSLCVIDRVTETVAYSKTGLTTGYSLAITPDGTKLYVGIGTAPSMQIKVLDATSPTYAVLSTITLTGNASAVADLVMSADGTKLYASTLAYSSTDGSIKVINTTTDTVSATISISGYTGVVDADGMVLSPDGSTIYAIVRASIAGIKIAMIDVATNTIVDDWSPSSYNLYSLAISDDGATLIATNYDGHTCEIINLPSQVTRQLFYIGDPTNSRQPNQVAINADESRIYMTAHYPDPTGSIVILDSQPPSLLSLAAIV